jgi:hypothetical protein
MKYILVLIQILAITSCSTMKKSQLYGAIAGGLICGTIGASMGKEMSPNKASSSFNKAIGFTAGSSLCAIGGHYVGKYFYKSEPRNIEYESIKFEKSEKSKTHQQVLNNNELIFNDLSLTNREIVEMPILKGVPKNLRDKISKQKIIKYKIKPQFLKMKDGRKIYFSGGDAIEHKYEPAQ